MIFSTYFYLYCHFGQYCSRCYVGNGDYNSFGDSQLSSTIYPGSFCAVATRSEPKIKETERKKERQLKSKFMYVQYVMPSRGNTMRLNLSPAN